MGFFRRKKDFLDLTGRTKDIQKTERGDEYVGEVSDTQNHFGIFDNPVSSGESDDSREFSKGLLEITGKIEDLSNQIYHLQQRIEVLERKVE